MNQTKQLQGESQYHKHWSKKYLKIRQKDKEPKSHEALQIIKSNWKRMEKYKI